MNDGKGMERGIETASERPGLASGMSQPSCHGSWKGLFDELRGETFAGLACSRINTGFKGIGTLFKPGESGENGSGANMGPGEGLPPDGAGYWHHFIPSSLPKPGPRFCRILRCFFGVIWTTHIGRTMIRKSNGAIVTRFMRGVSPRQKNRGFDFLRSEL